MRLKFPLRAQNVKKKGLFGFDGSTAGWLVFREPAPLVGKVLARQQVIDLAEETLWPV